MRRTMLYIPGNNPNMLVRGHLFGSDGLVLDLEDAVTISEKENARILVSRFLEQGEFGGSEVTVRINATDTEYWRDDLAAITRFPILSGVRVPKVEDALTVKMVDEELCALEAKYGIETGHVKIFCILESARGVWKAYDVATASSRVVAITPGGEDLVADLRSDRSPEGTELKWARQMMIFAARAAGVDALDTVYPITTDNEGLRRETEFIKQLGYDGKSVIHPNQISIVHEVFEPTEKEIERAMKITSAAKEAMKRGLGTVSVDGRMVDTPVVKRSEYILRKAGLAEVEIDG